MIVEPGATFLGDPSVFGTTGGNHLWIVAYVHTPEYATTPHAIVVNVTTARGRGDDRTCILNVGDHPFIKHESFVYYGEAREVEVADLVAMSSQGPVSSDLFQRVRSGFRNSRHVRNKMKGLV